jgi:hypothetical protein
MFAVNADREIGSEAFQPDPFSWRLSPQPLAKVSLTLSVTQLSLQQNKSTGMHQFDGVNKLPLRHAQHQSIPPGKLFPANSRRGHSILPTL